MGETKDKKYCVYKHTSPSGKVYIGITCQKVEYRWDNGNGYKGQVFYRAIQKYGWDNITHEILYCNLSREDACEMEIKLINFYNSSNNKFGYNQTKGGDYPWITGKKHSISTKRKIGMSNKGRKLTKEQYEKICIANRSMEKIKAHAEAHKRKVICIDTMEIFDSVKEASIIKNAPKVSDCCNRYYGRKSSNGYHFMYLEEYNKLKVNELNKLISEMFSNNSHSVKTNIKRGISNSYEVICLNNSMIFNTVKDASIFANVTSSTLNNAVNGKLLSAGKKNGEKLVWMKLHDYNKCNSSQIDVIIKNANIKKINNFKKVVCMNTKQIFTSMNDARDFIGHAKSSHIRQCCIGKRKMAGKHPVTGEPLQWMYYEDYLNLNEGGMQNEEKLCSLP